MAHSENDQAEYQAGDVFDDRFVLVEFLDTDQFAEIWSIRRLGNEDPPEQSPEVVRLPHTKRDTHLTFDKAFKTEFEIGRKVHHPNTVGASDYGFDSTRRTPYIIARVLDGETLAERLKTLARNVPEPELAWSIAVQAADGLAYVHEQGFVHSDVTPHNFFIEKNGVVRLQNFMTTRLFLWDGEPVDFDAGELGAITPIYASIEMFEGEDPEPRDDVYGFGVMLYQLFGGMYPYGMDSAPKAEEQKTRPDKVQRLSRSQNRALQRAVSFRAVDRTPTIPQLMEALQKPPSLLERLFG